MTTNTILRRRPPPPPPAVALRRRPDGAPYWAPPAARTSVRSGAAARTTTTPTLGLVKPVVGGDENVWGGYLNDNADRIDALVLPLTGGALTGPLTSTARISVQGAPITTDNTVLCHHLAAGIPGGANVGGFVGSWDEVTSGYAGFYTDASGNIVFAAADAGLGTVSGVRAAIGPDGSMQLNAGLTAGGPVTLPADPLQPLQAATKQYVDNKSGAFLPLAGGTVTGDLTVQGALAAANGLTVGIDAGGSGSVILNGVKQSPKAIYLRTGGKNRWIAQCDATNETGGNAGSNFALSRYDDAGLLLGNAVTIARLDGTTQFYAPVYLSGDPTAPTGAATKQYVDAHAGAGGIPDAPSDGKAYGRLNAGWTQVATAAQLGGYLPLTGGTLTGGLALSGAAGTTRTLSMQSGGLNRFMLFLGGGAETGSNAGSSFAISRYDDSGTLIDSPLGINRATGLTTFVNGIAAATGNITATAGSVVGAGGLMAGGNGVSYPTVQITGSAGGDRQLLLTTNGSSRWTIAANGVAEGGSNAGSDYSVSRFSDAGAYLGTPLQIARSTGLTTVSNGLTATAGNITASAGNVSASGGVSAGANILATGAVYGTTGVFADNTGNFGLFKSGNVSSIFFGSGGSSYRNTLDVSTGLWSWLNWQSTTVMTLDVSGNLTILGGTATKAGGGSWSAPSDARIKDVSGNYEHGLVEVCALQPVRYRYKSGVEVLNDDPETKPAPMFAANIAEADFVGLVAQDTEPHLPECVGVSGQTVTVDGATVGDLRTLDTGPLIFALVNAVKTLAARVEALEGAVLG